MEDSKLYSQNEYQKAARMMQEYVSESGFEIPVDRELIEKALDEFLTRFAPERLESLADEEILNTIFYSSRENHNALWYWLEKKSEYKKYFGSIAGGSAYKFGLFQKQSTGKWTSGSPQQPKTLDENEALVFGKQIRDALVHGANIVKRATLNTLEDYEKLDDKLKHTMGEQIANWGWVHKYLCMICPDKLCCFHSSDWQRHVLYALGIKPSDKYYARSGQLSMVENYAGWYYYEFISVVRERFGNIKQFVRIGTSDNTKNYMSEWSQKSVVGIGWRAIGSLLDYTVEDSLDRSALKESLKEKYYPSDERIASRKAGELIRFYKTDSNTIFVAMDGERLLALIDNIGPYFYDDSSAMSHRKTGKWNYCFVNSEQLPEKSAGKLTSCYQLTGDANLMYLYRKYYYGSDNNTLSDNSDEKINISNIPVLPIEEDFIMPDYYTGFESDYERNRIIFGAPGTGKSFKLKQEAEDLIRCAGRNMERVTFHTDYTYAQFVGTYKPVSDADGKIRYDFVPGPFMRVYVNAIKNSQQMIQTYRLIEQADVMHMFPTNPNPANGDEKWDLFEEITEIGQVETFHASKDAKVGDLALIYVTKTKPGYDNGIYAIGTIISKPDDNEAAIRFDYVSYYNPIIDYETLKEYNPNIRSNGKVNNEIMKLVKEVELPANPYLLIIEEINRAKVAAVFGDVFQLLDRDEDGVSEYGIHTSEDVRKYLSLQLKGDVNDWTEIKLPDNMFIWATMNSADQGVFPMDTAFKRRWDFEYLDINENEEKIRGRIMLGTDIIQEVEWNFLRRAINDKLSKEYKVNEDKLMGPFFLSKKTLQTRSEEDDRIIDTDRFIKAFKSKVIMYLYEDAARQYKHKLFAGCEDTTRYSSVCESFDKIGIQIFGEDFEDAYYNPQKW